MRLLPYLRTRSSITPKRSLPLSTVWVNPRESDSRLYDFVLRARGTWYGVSPAAGREEGRGRRSCKPALKPSDKNFRGRHSRGCISGTRPGTILRWESARKKASSRGDNEKNARALAREVVFPITLGGDLVRIYRLIKLSFFVVLVRRYNKRSPQVKHKLWWNT